MSTQLAIIDGQEHRLDIVNGRRLVVSTSLGAVICSILVSAQARTAPEIDDRVLLRDLNTLAADNMEGRRPGTPGHDRARDYVLRRFKESGLEPVDGRYDQEFTFEGRGEPSVVVPGTNVIGVVRGSSVPQLAIVVTAHYDHVGILNGRVFNGADDNASGTAALFSLASYFARHRPTHSIVFAALDAEEAGLRGARAFLASPPVPVTSIAINVNLDMIARDAKGVLYAAGVSRYPYLKPLVDRVAARAPVALKLGHDGPGAPTVEDWTRESDHYAFHERGIPFIYFGVEDNEQHHKATDDPETITPSFFINAVNTVLDALVEIDAGLQTLAARRR